MCGIAQETLADCQAKAEQLLEVLSAESRALRQYDAKLLLQLIAQKEYSLNVLSESMKALKCCRTRAEDGEDSLALETLKRMLREIARLNGANRVFIQGSLDHFQDLLVTLVPIMYGQHEGNPTHQMVNCTGVAIKKKA
jgi:flagellar biosynthesis/type III secretory pathway chaperone